MEQLRHFPIPSNDDRRVETMEKLDLERRRGDPFFEYVTEEVRELFDAPIGFVSLMGETEQTLLHCNGADVPGTPRDMSLCALTVAARETIVFHDTHLDPRSAGHPIVTGGFQLRFSASAPVILSTGFCIGTLCAVDTQPHPAPDAGQLRRLERLAAMVARFYEAPVEPDAARAREIQRIAAAAQEEFLALVSHELRNPLNGIVGLMDLIGPTEGDDADILDAMRQSCDHLDRVVGSVLQFTELNSGTIELNEGRSDLARLVRDAVATAGPMMKLRGKSCDLDGVPETLGMLVDREQIELMLGCLVMNFVLHGGNACGVRLSQETDGNVMLVFSDNGDGISADRLDRVFRAFGTGEEVMTRKADGMGLGLPLTRKIVDMHGGDVLLFSDERGLQVTLRLPGWRVG